MRLKPLIRGYKAQEDVLPGDNVVGGSVGNVTWLICEVDRDKGLTVEGHHC